jgi:hypothetical protein
VVCGVVAIAFNNGWSVAPSGTRHYSSSIALINPGETVQTVSLPSGSWQDLYGGAVADPSKVVLVPASGLVLLKGKQ